MIAVSREGNSLYRDKVIVRRLRLERPISPAVERAVGKILPLPRSAVALHAAFTLSYRDT